MILVRVFHERNDHVLVIIDADIIFVRLCITMNTHIFSNEEICILRGGILMVV